MVTNIASESIQQRCVRPLSSGISVHPLIVELDRPVARRTLTSSAGS
jgi:hypothetical protein